MTATITIGCYDGLGVEDATAWVDEYTTDGDVRYGYPVYDRFREEARCHPLDEADLLASGLLNAPLRKLDPFYWLRERLDELNTALDAIPCHAALTSTSEDLAKVSGLFAILDGSRSGIGRTTLSKILHRKRQDFIPLYDKYVGRCYLSRIGLPRAGAGINQRSAYMAELANEMLIDLRQSGWQELSALGKERDISDLRVLDILAWKLGRTRGSLT